MTETEEPKQTAVIGRGESIITKKLPPADVEAENSAELAKREEEEIAGIKESQGWVFPKVKLSAWVSTTALVRRRRRPSAPLGITDIRKLHFSNPPNFFINLNRTPRTRNNGKPPANSLPAVTCLRRFLT